MVIEFVIELVAKFETEFKQTFLDTETERNITKLIKRKLSLQVSSISTTSLLYSGNKTSNKI